MTITLNNAPSGSQTIVNGSTVTPFGTVTIEDTNNSASFGTITVTETPNDVIDANGGLSDSLTTVSQGSSPNVYVLTDAIGMLSSDLNALVFTPSTSGQTTFDVSVSDEQGGEPGTATNTIISRTGPAIGLGAMGQTSQNQASVHPFSGFTVSDDPGPTITASVTISQPSQGTLGNLGGFTSAGTAGVYVETGTTTDINTDLAAITFVPSSGSVGNTVTTDFVVNANDGTLTANSGSTSVQAAFGPVITGTATSSTIASLGTAIPFGSVVLSDASGQTEIATVTLSDHTHGSLNSTGGGTYNSGTGVYTVSGAPGAVTNALDHLIFNAGSVAPGAIVSTTTLSLNVTDTASASPSTPPSATITAVGGPLLTGVGVGSTLAGTATASPFSTVSISDAAGQTETVTVTLSDHTHGSLTSTGGGTYNSTTGVYAITGSAGVVSTALSSLVFTPVPVAGQSTSTSLVLNDTDTAGLSTSTAATITDLGGPLLAGSVVSTPTLVGTATASPFSAVTLTDVAGQTETVTVTLSDHTHGSLSSTTGGTYTASTGVYSITGSAAAVTTALNNLVFSPVPVTGQSTTNTLTLNVTDNAALNTGTVVTVTDIGGPLLSGSVAAMATVAGTATASPFSAVTVTDAAGQAETVTVTLSDHTHGALSSASGGTYNATTGVYTITGSAAAVTTALQTLAFTPVPAAGQSISTNLTLSVTDSAGLNAGTVAAVTDLGGPLLGGSVVSMPTVAGTATTSPFSAVTLTDVAGQTETVTVTLSDHTHGALSSTGGGTYNGTTGVYSITGGATAVATALRGLVFTPIPTAGQIISTGLTLSITDSAGLNAGTVATVTDLGGPLLGGTVTPTPTLVATATSSPFSGITLTDVAGQTETATVTLSNPTHGALSSTVGGAYNNTTGVYTITGSAAAVTMALDTLVFTPVVMAGQGTSTNLTLSVTDSAGLNAGTVASVVDLGGPLLAGTFVSAPTLAGTASANPFSAVSLTDAAGQTETVTVTLSNPTHGALTNPGPGTYNGTTGVYTISGSAATVATALQGLVFTPVPMAGQSISTGLTLSVTDSAGLNAGTVVTVTDLGGPLLGGTVTPTPTLAGTASASPFGAVTLADVAGQTETVTVRLSDPTHGTLSNLGGGTFNNGTYTITGSSTAVATALQGLVFTPIPMAGQSISTGLTLNVTDSAGLNAGTVATVTDLGGPLLGGSIASAPTLAGTASTSPFSALTLTDVSGQTETATVTLSNHTHGTLTVTGTGSYNGSTGVYTVTGSAAQVTTALRNLVFTPVSTPGQGTSTGLTLGVTDSAGLNAGSVVVAVTDVGGPLIGGSIVATTIACTTTAVPFGATTLSDALGQTETATVVLTNPDAGTLGNLGQGSYNTATGTFTDVGSTSVVIADLRGLVFLPTDTLTPGQTISTNVALTISDSVGLSATSGATITTIGAPRINAVTPSSTIASTATTMPFSDAAIDDAMGQTDTVTVALSNPANGTLGGGQSGSYDPDTGIYTFVDSADAVTADLQAVTFTPDAVAAGQGTETTLTVNVTNSSDLPAYASATTITAVGGPAVSGLTSGESIDSAATVTPFGNITIADDPSQSETVTLALSDASTGTLSNLGNGTYTDGTYTDTGSAATVTSDLRGLTFTPLLGQNATTTFTLGVVDGVGLSTSGTTTVAVTAPTPAAATVPYDLSGTGVSDILFRNNTTGEMGWYVPGTGSGPSSWNEYGSTSTDFTVVGVGDFNGDGTSDILFRNATTGDIGYLANHPNGPTNWVGLGGSAIGWSVLGTGDFNGDGTSDILFRNDTTGDTGVFLLGASGQNTWQGLGPTSLMYSVVGVGRFSGDGKADILFENTTNGDTGYYELGAGSPPGRWISLRPVLSPAYTACGVGDFNSDGTSDVLYHNNSTGDLGYVEIPANGSPISWVHVGFTSSDYSILGVADFDGNGVRDVLFHNQTTGDTGYAAVTPSGLGPWHGLGPSSTAFSVVASPTYG